MESKRSRRKRKRSSSLGNINAYNKKDHLDQALRFCEEVRKETSSEDYLMLLRCLHDYGTGNISMVDLKMKIADYFPSSINDFYRVLEHYDGKMGDVGKKKAEEGIDDGLLTESYQFLPKEVAGLSCKGATELEKQVFNRICYCKGSDSTRHVERSISHAEKELNEREDELFITDMWKAWMRSTRENATKLDRAIRDGIIQNPTVKEVNSYFPEYNFSFIAKVYGRDGWSMVDHLREKPQTFLPVLIRRLNRMEIESLPLWTLH